MCWRCGYSQRCITVTEYVPVVSSSSAVTVTQTVVSPGTEYMSEGEKVQHLWANAEDAGGIVARSRSRSLHGILGFTFPYRDHAPTQLSELGILQEVSLDVLFKFGLPEFSIAFGRVCLLATLMAMPVTTIY